jgi:hypothetical protein
MLSQALPAAIQHRTPNYIAVACNFHAFFMAFLETYKLLVRASPGHAAIAHLEFDGVTLNDASISRCAEPLLMQPTMYLLISLFGHPFKDSTVSCQARLLGADVADVAL